MGVASRDNNDVPTLLGVSNADGTTPTTVYADPVTHRLLVDLPGGSGSVSSVSVVTDNGFAGTVANPTSTPAITIETTVTGIVKGDGTAISAASAGTDYTALAFKTIAVSGQSDVVADSAADTLTLAEGSGITITTDAGTDTVTITATGSGTGDVVGPASATDSAVALYDGTTGKLIKNGVIYGTASAASTIIQRDANQNAFANNFVSKATNNAAGAGTTVLTAASTRIQNFTGASTQTYQLPDATTLTIGAQFQINNNGGGVVTIKDNGSNTITTIPIGGIIIVLAIAVSTTNGAWDYHPLLPANASWGTSSLTFADAQNIVVNATTGTKIGTATTQKLAFYNSTPIVQPTGDVITALQNLGLGASLTVAATSIVVGTTTIGSGTTTRILYDNAGTLGEYTLTGSGTVVAMQTAPTFVTSITTPSVLATSNDSGALGASGTAFSDLFLASGGVINWAAGDVVVTHTSGILTIGTGTLKITTPTNTSTSVVTIDGTQTLTNKSIVASQVTTGTFGTGAYTMDTSLTIPQVFNTDHAATVSSNAATITRAYRNNTFTNSSAATMAITLSTTSAAGGDMLLVQIYDFSGVAQTIGWTNTENSTISAPTTSNGSTTLPITVGFKWNTGTSKWRCVASC